MAGSRAESQKSQFSGRRRSNTAQSILRSAAPVITTLQVGDYKILNAWVHDNVKESNAILFNQSLWPGVVEGDMLRVTASSEDSDPSAGILFIVPKDENPSKPQLQISIPKPVADAFNWRNNMEVMVTKVERENHQADYVELIFQDQYLGRNDMWRLGEHLVGQCIYKNQEISFIGAIAAKIHSIYVNGKQVSAACMTATTKTIYRSLSAKVMIFIQVCRELWEFSGDGERYNEKIVHSFLPALFAKWREAGTNHIVTIVLISRVYYEQSEIDYAAGPLRVDDQGNWYKDFYKVITDLEVIYDWKPTLVSLKNSFWDFQRDILLTHHHHRAAADPQAGTADQVRLVGRLSFAHDGPVLEALNLALNPTETHYIDRSLSLTGATTILITPGTGYFRVSKALLRLTTTRMLDQGFGLDLISLAKPPLHQSPVFSFEGIDPELKTDKDPRISLNARSMDPLWGGSDNPADPLNKTVFWWEPFWISITFWDGQMDLPFRQDRFIARAKMHEIQMLGLLEHDVLSSIEIPFLSVAEAEISTFTERMEDRRPFKVKADKYDSSVFTLKPDNKLSTNSRSSHPSSYASSSSGTVVAASYRTITEKRTHVSHRNAIDSAKIPPIEESPLRIVMDLPPEERITQSGFLSVASTSPSRASLQSIQSSQRMGRPESPGGRSRDSSSTRSVTTKGKNSSWWFHPFRSVPSEPETTQVSASASPSSSRASLSLMPISSPVRMPAVSKATVKQSDVTNTSVPATAKTASSIRSTASRAIDDDTPSLRTPLVRYSPINTPPRDDHMAIKRRSANLATPVASSSPSSRPNPSRKESAISGAQSSLARRWQHMFPQPVYKHEIKWRSMVTPGCLPLTGEYFPSASELESSYDVYSYDFVVDLREMHPFLVKVPPSRGNEDDNRRSWALVVMRGMAAIRLAQGFQFVLRPPKADSLPVEAKALYRRTASSYLTDDDMTPKPKGAAEILQSTVDPIYLSMSNEIHRIAYEGDTIKVSRYVRRMPSMPPIQYKCLIWPKLGGGYTELSTEFTSHGFEGHVWNRLDMLAGGYEQQFDEAVRYWRTRFIVIPTIERPPLTNVGPQGEALNDEETRILGIEKLAEIFTKLRWQVDDKTPPVRFLPTTLGPAMSVLDDSLMAQLDEIHAAGPLRKKMKSEREISEMPLQAIPKAMREEDGVPIKHYQWHGAQYHNSFTGFDFVSWVVREFRDVSSRAQGTEFGVKLMEQGVIEHCRGYHGFLDGHYFYRFKGEFAVPMTPRGWFKSRRSGADELGRSYYPSSNIMGKRKPASPRRRKKKLILSQTLVIDVDPNKRSDQAETVILHHDIIHNPGTVFHFELQWIGTTARCIEDQLRQWSRTIERYGLKLVEAYVTQICDVRERNAFQSCFPVRLAIPPPVVPDLERRVPENTQTKCYFEYALLRRFDFILDIEASEMYPDSVDVVYSYRRSPYKHSQFVHRSGVAFVQVLGGSQGFLFLTNRLMGPGRMGTAVKSKDHRPAAAAEEIRIRLNSFCCDGASLTKFYDDELALLGNPEPEDPPPLSI
ncbi:Vacuolar membrane-associated protein IML1 [Pleurotus pulmonarius]